MRVDIEQTCQFVCEKSLLVVGFDWVCFWVPIYTVKGPLVAAVVILSRGWWFRGGGGFCGFALMPCDLGGGYANCCCVI